MARGDQPDDRPEEASDERLASQACAGDTGAFQTLVERFRPRLVHFLWGRVRHLADAEDLTQDTFARALENLGRFDPNQRFSTWLFTIASRLAIDQGRRKSRTRPTVPIEQAPGLPGNGHKPAETVAEDEWRTNLWACAAAVLSKEQYTGLWLQHAEQFELKQIAEILGRKPVHMRVMLMRARRQLANYLNRDGTLVQPPESPTAEANDAASDTNNAQRNPGATQDQTHWPTAPGEREVTE